MDKKEFTDLLHELEVSYYKKQLSERFKLSQQFDDANLEWKKSKNKLFQFFDSVAGNQ